MSSSAPKATQLPPKGDPRTLYLIDISGYVFRAYHALPPLMSPKGEPSHAVLGVTTMLLKLVEDQKPALFAVAMDSKGKSFRHQLFPEYKANRPTPPPDLGQQIARVREVVEAYAIPVLQQDGVEADDLIAAFVTAARKDNLHVVIVSADKDLLQLVSDDVVMYDTGRNLVFGRQETHDKLGVFPEQVRDYLALVGDSSDNVPGVPGIGPKTAVQLINDFGTLDGIYEGLDTLSKKGVREKLIENRDKAFLSRELVSLRDSLDVKVDLEALAWNGANIAKLHEIFLELGFTRLLRELPKLEAAHPEQLGLTAATDETTAIALAESGDTRDARDAPPDTDDPSAHARLSRPPSAPAPLRPCTVVLDEGTLSALIAKLERSESFLLVSVLDSPRAVDADLTGLILSTETSSAYIPLGHTYLGHPELLPRADVLARLKPLLSSGWPMKICLDSKRDATTLARHDITLAGVAFDIMLASYLIDAERHGHSLREIASELGERDLTAAEAIMARPTTGTKHTSAAEIDVEHAGVFAGEIAHVAHVAHEDLSRRLRELECETLLHDMEIPLAFVLSEMERTGIVVDPRQLVRLSTQIAEQLTTLEAKSKQLAGRDFNVGSPRQLETILFDQLGLPVIKRTKTARSTDHDVLEELALQHELPATILEHRMLAKLKNTYLDALPREISPRTGRIHTDFRQTVAATGRLSSTDPNLQNIPIRSELGRSIRHSFVARDGWQMMSADYSQIELRVLAHLSHDRELVEAFAENHDVHLRTARAIFGVSERDVTREMRGQAKTVNFAVIYGQTQFALARNLRIERAEAGRYIKAFFEQYAGVQRYLDEVVAQARETGVTRTLLGRVRKLPDLRADHRVKREAAERVARNTPIQGSAADIIKLAMVSIQRELEARKLQSKMLLTVHDELVFEAPAEEKAALEALVLDKMQNAVQLDVPLVVEHGWGQNWGDAH